MGNILKRFRKSFALYLNLSVSVVASKYKIWRVLRRRHWNGSRKEDLAEQRRRSFQAEGTRGLGGLAEVPTWPHTHAHTQPLPWFRVIISDADHCNSLFMGLLASRKGAQNILCF